MFSLAHSMICSGVVLPLAWARSTTTALTVSPRYGSRVPMMQASCTSGCLYSRFSTSAGHTLKPDALIMRLRRSVMKK
ncbi:hypothetical protein D3C72_2091420 [compost metagenome]